MASLKLTSRKRAGLVNLVCAIVDYLLFYVIFTSGNIHYLQANMIAYTSCVIVHYVANITFVFKGSEADTRNQELLIFVALSVVALGLSQLIMWLCVEEFAIEPMTVKIFASLIALLYNYAMRKLIFEQPLSIR